ncbi:CCCH-type zinc fingerfamily protein with RNA-binding domain [Hibiscus syriacus]|uniref:CCCH-type zinc fingerfamily protein with RNA-binding domain n=1 Tax=Hibiscus syriacus TaxID=106335 RepID=A0A6A3ANN1_HIBSY|nr:CCCH-type zinc fingerfamily protein with RNA-binding domain [Hibiscus syriacus]
MGFFFQICAYAFLNLSTPGSTMGTGKLDRTSALLLYLIFVVVPSFSTLASADKPSLAVGEFNKTLQLIPGIQVEKSPGLKPGTKVVCERIYIDGLSRFRNLRKFAHSFKLKVSQGNSNLRRPSVEVCCHRNASLGIGMCPQGKWEKVSNGLWAKPMSPFNHKLLDIRMTSSSTQTLEVSIEEGKFVILLPLLLYCGIYPKQVFSILLQQRNGDWGHPCGIDGPVSGNEASPNWSEELTGYCLYHLWWLGLGFFLLRYIPRLLQSVLLELGITEDMYNPLAIFLLGFLVLAGAWLGFWVVRKLVLTEDGSIDISTSYFVACSIRIVAAIMMLQVVPLIVSLYYSQIHGRPALSFHQKKLLIGKLFKLAKAIGRNTQIPDLSPNQDSHDEYKYDSPEYSNFLEQRSNPFHLASCNTTLQENKCFLCPLLQELPRHSNRLSDTDSFPSIIHNTPERRNFSKGGWEKFTRDSTKKAVEELVSLPDFSKWAAANDERITVTPKSSSGTASARPRRWFLWS